MRPSAQAVADTDRRSEIRVVQKLRIIDIDVAGRRYPFTLDNLSGRGGSGRCGQYFLPGTTVTLIFESKRPVAGHVRWVRDALVGVEFLSALPADLMQAGAAVQRQRAPRYSVARPATIRERGIDLRATIRNISRSGLLLESECALLPGQPITISCGSFEAAGHVRWSRGGKAGVQLVRAIDVEDFDTASNRRA